MEHGYIRSRWVVEVDVSELHISFDALGLMIPRLLNVDLGLPINGITNPISRNGALDEDSIIGRYLGKGRTRKIDRKDGHHNVGHSRLTQHELLGTKPEPQRIAADLKSHAA